MNLVLLGPPAVGKGTLAKRLAQDLGFVVLSAGDLLRDEVARGTEIGKEAGPIMKRGELLPEHIVVGVMAKHVAQVDPAKGILFDGFPRTIGQAEALEAILVNENRVLNRVVELQACDDILIERFQKRVAAATARGETPREDDNLVTFQHRLGIYNVESAQLVPYYNKQLILESIDATQSVDDSMRQLVDALVIPAHWPYTHCQSVSDKPDNTPTPS